MTVSQSWPHWRRSLARLELALVATQMPQATTSRATTSRAMANVATAAKPRFVVAHVVTHVSSRMKASHGGWLRVRWWPVVAVVGVVRGGRLPGVRCDSTAEARPRLPTGSEAIGQGADRAPRQPAEDPRSVWMNEALPRCATRIPATSLRQLPPRWPAPLVPQRGQHGTVA